MFITDAKVGDNGKEMKGGHKEGTRKQKVRKVPLCCIDGHPPHSKVRVHPGECSLEQSQVWKYENLIGAIINKVVDGCSENEFKFILQYKYHH